MSTTTEPKTEQKPASKNRAQLPAIPPAPGRSPTSAVSIPHAGPNYLTDTAAFEHLWRVAVAFSRSTLVPDIFRNKPDDCFIAAQLAVRLNVDLFMLLQNIYVVHGKPDFQAKLSIGLLNESGKIRGTVRYCFDGEGDDYGCTAHVIDAFAGEVVEGPKVDLKMVKAEKWDQPKKGIPSKWTTMPDQMFRYRSATFLIRAHYPEVLMGLHTSDELEDMPPLADSPRIAPSSLRQLEDKLEGQPDSPDDTPDDPPEIVSREALAEAAELFLGATTISECTAIGREFDNRTDLSQATKDKLLEIWQKRKEEIGTREGFQKVLADATTVPAVTRILAGWIPQLAESDHPWARDQAGKQKVEIRAAEKKAKAEAATEA